MEVIINSLFYLPYIPDVFVTAGAAWGINTGCLCILPYFFTLITFLLLILVVTATFRSVKFEYRNFLTFLIAGGIFMTASIFIKLFILLGASSGGVSEPMSLRADLVSGFFQLIGLAFLLWAIVFNVRKKLRKLTK